MSTNDKTAVDNETKKKIEKLKETISESLGLSNTKLNELEKELQAFQNELQSSNQSLITDQMNSSEQIIRLYTVERSLTEILQQKIIQLEADLIDSKVNYNAFASTKNQIEELKNYISKEFSNFKNDLISNTVVNKQQVLSTENVKQENKGSIEGLISSENKMNKEERMRLQTENQELQKELHFYQEKNENLKKELQYKNQEINSFKKAMQETEENTEDDYLTKKSVNDEYGYTLEEEFELTKEELNTLKGKYITLEKDNEKIVKSIESYKKELTDLKRILANKNNEIKELKRNTQVAGEENLVEQLQPSTTNNISEQEPQNKNDQINSLKAELLEKEKKLSQIEARNTELVNETKRLESKNSEKELMTLQLEADKLSKAVWKIEKLIGIFESGISTDANTFERHVEVYGLLLNKIYNARGYGLILDTLLKHKGKVLNKKMVMSESKTEPHITIRILRELHDSKVIHFDEMNDQIIWR